MKVNLNQKNEKVECRKGKKLIMTKIILLSIIEGLMALVLFRQQNTWLFIALWALTILLDRTIIKKIQKEM